MMTGFLLRKLGLIDEKFSSYLDKFVFRFALPILLFQDMALQDFSANWNARFILFCVFATIVSVGLISLISRFVIREKTSLRGEFIQASYRSSAAILGGAFIQNLYGEGTSIVGPLMILASVPLYNIFAVTVLTLTSPGNSGSNKNQISKTIVGILKNPLIIGILAGMVWSVLKIPVPVILRTTMKNIAGLATPLGLISMGSALELSKIQKSLKLSSVVTCIKLILLVAIFLPIVVLAGFRQQELIAILVMLGSASTVSCYIMARNMGFDGDLTASSVALTTFCCSFTLTFWIWLLRSGGLV